MRTHTTLSDRAERVDDVVWASGKPVLLNANLDAGHRGASGRYDALREAAFNGAYILTRVGIERSSR